MNVKDTCQRGDESGGKCDRNDGDSVSLYRYEGWEFAYSCSPIVDRCFFDPDTYDSLDCAGAVTENVIVSTKR